ncbi:hypothetical protein AAKU55_003886 [Oxalobacteraceae bacterium GrIS 1.11]
MPVVVWVISAVRTPKNSPKCASERTPKEGASGANFSYENSEFFEAESSLKSAASKRCAKRGAQYGAQNPFRYNPANSQKYNKSAKNTPPQSPAASTSPPPQKATMQTPQPHTHQKPTAT